jgi:hypothetical protein
MSTLINDGKEEYMRILISQKGKLEIHTMRSNVKGMKTIEMEIPGV